MLEPDEEDRLMQVVSKRLRAVYWRLLIELAIETSAREQELVLAEVSEVNFRSKVWTIPKEHSKTDYVRDVPLSKNAVKIILALKSMLDQHNAALVSKRPHDHTPETRLFFKFASPSSVCTGFADIVKAADIKDFRFHDLRHTAITRMTLNKRELEVHEIMRLAGHRSMKMFIHYSNYRAEDLVNRMG